MPLTFSADTPRWLRRLATREAKRLLLLDEWQIHIEIADEDEIDAEGYCRWLYEYRSAHITLSSGLENDAHGRRTARHELLHCILSGIMHAFEQSWQKRKLPKPVARKLLADSVETVIQRLTLVLD